MANQTNIYTMSAAPRFVGVNCAQADVNNTSYVSPARTRFRFRLRLITGPAHLNHLY